jgi:hypothetical protein
MKLFGKIEKLVQLLFSTNGQTVTVNPPAAPGENQTFTLPDLNTTDTHTLVTESLNQTLTNKTIDGDDNTVQDLALGSLKTVAGKAYRTLFRDASGVVVDDSTGAMVPPSGTTAQRPTASTGMVRYNSTLNQLEVYNGTLWNNIVKPAQIITVAVSGGDFTSIQAAINSISDASSSKPYVIRVAPGVFTEDVTLKDWVFIENGISGAVKIAGSVTATGLTGTSGIKGITIEKTPTAGGQYGLSQSGGIFIISEIDIYILGSANYAVTGALLSSGTALTIFNSTVWDRRSGNINTNFEGWSFAGSGTYGIFNASVSARGSYTGGTHCLFSVSCTGSFTMSGGAAIFGGTGALGSGIVRGFCVSSASTSPRFTSNLQVRLTSASGGTGVGFRISNGTADFQHIGSAVNISGFTAGQEYVTDTASGDTQKLWSCSTNKYFTKTGSGTAIVTPLDDAKSGFLEYAGNPADGSTTFWSWAAPNFTVSLAGSGIVRGAPVAWTAGQSVALTDLATNYIYMTSAGVIGATTTFSESLYSDNVVLLEAWRDGSNLIVTKENHPYKFDTAVSHAWHRLFGILLEGTGTNLKILNASARTLYISGTDVLTDHGLDTTIPADAGPLSVNYVWVNDGTGKARLYSTATAIPDVMDSGSTTTTVGTNKYVVFRFFVSKNNLNATTPQYFGIIPTTEYSTLANAQAAITGGSIQTLPPEIKSLECAQIAYVICYKNPGGSYSIVTPEATGVIIEKQTFTARFLGGSASNSAGLVTTDTTNFGGILSGADVNVQAALDTLDDNAVKKGTGVFTDQALARYNGTGGQQLDDACSATPVTMSDTGVLTINNTTASSSKDTGALIVEGGVGVEEDVYAGGQVVAPTVSGTTSVTTPLVVVSSGGTAASGKISYNSNKIELGTVFKVADTGAVTALTVDGTTIAASTALTLEETGAGTDKITLQAPASIAASYTLTLPVDDGAANQVLVTDGSGVLSWATPAGTGDILNGGNATGATVVLGTNDEQNLALETNGTTRLTIDKTTGVVSLTEGLTLATGKVLTAETIQAVDGDGVTIKDDAGTACLVVADGGAVTVGPSSGLNATHLIQSAQSGNVIASFKNTGASSNSYVSFVGGSSTLGYIGHASDSSLNFIASNGSTVKASCTDAGAWVWGPTAFAGEHQVNGNIRFQRSTSGGNIIIMSNMIQDAAGTYAVKYNTTTGVISYTSSARHHKEQIEPIKYGLSHILNLKPCSYIRKSTGEKELGMIADEVFTVLPEAAPLCKPEFFGLEGSELMPAGVHYDMIIPVLVKAMQELHSLCSATNQQVVELRAALDEANAKIAVLEQP